MSLFHTLKDLEIDFASRWEASDKTQATYDSMQADYIAAYNAAMHDKAQQVHESDPPGHPIRP